MSEASERPGRALGLDVGERRIGVAVSDELGLIASPAATIDLEREGLNALLSLIERYAPSVIVVGLPVTMRGREGAQAAETRRFVELLRPHVRCPIVFWDERLTSTAAERLLTESGMRRNRRRQTVDAVAAALLLQSYLDAQRSRQGRGEQK
ncbi:Holliday junction resolvase RuvX [Thermomicrobium sp. 4228-Ro]|uniref:Holliday junction resolvase RuvX n=1 Tax=Thermomicrobium sp. 4228-Ro TaxID=2993937 RepID=UPI0022497D0A|nr:Holliday junction resolvase RuvX [Thermomicrobium sp. 4228-Ro]MCX2726172.1 Holliday junction resolvase RuvX [Thermomicrobium sp. 4228-Ro]